MIDLQPVPIPDLSDESMASHRATLIEAITNRRHRPMKWAALVGATGVAAAVSTLFLVGGNEQSMSPADAAILTSAQAALTPPAGSVLHVVAMITVGSQPAQPYELWATGSSARGFKFGQELAWNGSQMMIYNPATNTISILPVSPSHPPVDQATTVRSLITSGQAHVTGTSVVGGVSAYVLTLSGMPDGDGVANGTYDVAKSDYHPLLIQTSVVCDDQGHQCPETISYQTYEYLPATPANLSLLDLKAQHPGAKVQSGAGADPGARSTD